LDSRVFVQFFTTHVPPLRGGTCVVVKKESGEGAAYILQMFSVDALEAEQREIHKLHTELAVRNAEISRAIVKRRGLYHEYLDREALLCLRITCPDVCNTDFNMMCVTFNNGVRAIMEDPKWIVFHVEKGPWVVKLNLESGISFANHSAGYQGTGGMTRTLIRITQVEEFAIGIATGVVPLWRHKIRPSLTEEIVSQLYQRCAIIWLSRELPGTWPDILKDFVVKIL
jgi:hypothetical protein